MNYLWIAAGMGAAHVILWSPDNGGAAVVIFLLIIAAVAEAEKG
jgi:hypothetical protein